ncbi:MAG: MBL fold metallo-hydrolase [Propionibacteriaceae bacterium]|nr:MBL fold metallo-hydrolase [Propionibacteriaceae bacterium]
MLLEILPVGPLQANCYVLGVEPGGPCVIIDPGMDAFETVRDCVAGNDLTPMAILATHGHFDHIGNAQIVADHYEIPVRIHSDDRDLLATPEKGMGPDMAVWYAMAVPGGVTEPALVEPVRDGEVIQVANLEFLVTHAPGHSPGSVLYTLSYDGDSMCFSGDVLFAGSIGRTDLPGGNHDTMIATLREKILPVSDETKIFPGHGPDTDMAVERATNPYLQPRFLAH